MLVAEYTEEKLDYDVHIEAALVQYIAIYFVSQTHLCWKYLFSTAPVFWITGKKGPKLLALTAVAIIWCWKTILLPKVMTDIINQAPSLVSSILPNFFFFFSFWTTDVFILSYIPLFCVVGLFSSKVSLKCLYQRNQWSKVEEAVSRSEGWCFL